MNQTYFYIGSLIFLCSATQPIQAMQSKKSNNCFASLVAALTHRRSHAQIVHPAESISTQSISLQSVPPQLNDAIPTDIVIPVEDFTPPIKIGFGLGEYSAPIKEIWFRTMASKADVIVLEHQESGDTLSLGAQDNNLNAPDGGKELRVSSPFIFDASRRDYRTKRAKIIRPPDLNRKIAMIHWASIGTHPGLKLIIDPAVECRVCQRPWSYKELEEMWKNQDFDPTPGMLMRCVVKPTNNITAAAEGLESAEHNFIIHRLNNDNIPLKGNIIYVGENSSEIKESNNFKLDK